MAKKKQELNDLAYSQLHTLEQDLRKEQRELRFDMILSAVENPARIKDVRRDIARVKTIMHEMDLGIREKKELQ
ncbi:MAG: 50S ribosomal protein L29 [Spirochaetota bacterium]